MIELSQLLEHNQFLAGGAVLGSVGLAWNYIRSLPGIVVSFARNKLTMSITIHENDLAFDWVTKYLTKNLKNKRHVNTKTKLVNSDAGKSYNIELIPAQGNHFGWFRKMPMWITKDGPDQSSSKDNAESNDDKMAKYFKKESYKISFLWHDLTLMNDFIKYCEEHHAIKPHEKFFVPVYVNSYGGWSCLDHKEPRLPDSIISCDNKHMELIADVNRFRRAKKKYLSLGVPYHRGYLLHGKAGNGKSSLAHAVASMFGGERIYFLQLSGVKDDRELMSLISNIQLCAVLLIEDIDCAFDQRENETGVTLSGLLNALDGVCAKEGQIVFMTTNHIEKLDPALIRPGRIDFRMEFDHPTLEMIEEIALRFYPNKGTAWIKQFVEEFRDKEVSLAQVQNKLLDLGCLHSDFSGDPLNLAENSNYNSASETLLQDF